MHDENTRCCVSQEMLHGPQNHAENEGGTAGKTQNVYIRVRFHITRNYQIENVCTSQSCMVSKLRIICKQIVGL